MLLSARTGGHGARHINGGMIIEKRRKNPGDRGDLLSMLIDAHLEDDTGRMTDAQLRDEVMTIPAGSIVFVPTFIIHRHPCFWRDPEGFDPDRFDQAPPKNAYLPFGAGPRQCIGNSFTMMESQLVLATLLARFTRRNKGLRRGKRGK